LFSFEEHDLVLPMIVLEDAEIIATFLHGGMDQHSSIVMRSPMLIP
jgi:predicted ribonuclease YlaK